MFYNENFYYLLCFCTNLLYGKNVVPEIWAKMLSAIEIAGLLNQAFLQSKSMKEPLFLHVLTKIKLMEKFLLGHGQKSVGPIWSLDSKIDSISRTDFLHAGAVSHKLKGD